VPAGVVAVALVVPTSSSALDAAVPTCATPYGITISLLYCMPDNISGTILQHREPANSYDQYAIQLFGDDAKLNFDYLPMPLQS
jgi:hypothetical protein